MDTNASSEDRADRSMLNERYRTPSGRIFTYRQRLTAARTRVAADKKQGVTTPEWIVALAAVDISNHE